MFDDVQATLDRLVDLLNRDQLEELAELHDFPFVMQMDKSMVVFQSPRHAVSAWRAYRRDFISQGLVRSRAKILATELPRNERFRVWAEMQHLDRTEAMAGSAQLILFFCGRTAPFRLEMQHVTNPYLVPRWTLAGNLASLA